MTDNIERALRAERALKEYIELDPHASMQTWVTDFLTDAMHLAHWASYRGTDFNKAAQTAKTHFAAETKE